MKTYGKQLYDSILASINSLEKNLNTYNQQISKTGIPILLSGNHWPSELKDALHQAETSTRSRTAQLYEQLDIVADYYGLRNPYPRYPYG